MLAFAGFTTLFLGVLAVLSGDLELGLMMLGSGVILLMAAVQRA